MPRFPPLLIWSVRSHDASIRSRHSPGRPRRRASAQDCYKTSLLSPSPFLGNHGEIAKLADGSLWEVQFSYEYMYEYYPSVVICPGQGKLIVHDKALDVRSVAVRPGRKGGGAVVESMIVNKFTGLKAGNIYRLANGQIWEQTEGWTWAWSWSNPSVMIYSGPGGYKMKVENIDRSVGVQRIK